MPDFKYSQSLVLTSESQLIFFYNRPVQLDYIPGETKLHRDLPVNLKLYHYSSQDIFLIPHHNGIAHPRVWF